MLRITAIVILLFVFGQLKAQEYPVVGKPCPEFILKNVQYYPKKIVTHNDLKGKPVILDLFSLGCTGCFSAFPEMENLRKTYGDQVQFIVVGQDSRKFHNKLVKTYELFRTKYDLGFAVAYDSVIFEKFRVQGVPHTIWIDKDGIVRSVTAGEITKENIENFLAGLPVKGLGRSYEERIARNKTKSEIYASQSSAIDSCLIQSSSLYTWKPGMPEMSPFLATFKAQAMNLELSGLSLEKLYRVAYMGKSSEWLYNDKEFYGKKRFRPEYHIKDPSLFEVDYQTSRNLFCYAQKLPASKRTIKNMINVMRTDLQNFFGYQVTIENRATKVWKLVASDEAKRKLKSKGGDWRLGEMGKSISEIKIINQPISALIQVINDGPSLSYNDIYIIDETGIDFNIDLTVQCIVTDFDQVKAALHKIGLDFVETTIDLETIVIRDSDHLESLSREETIALELRNGNMKFFEDLLKTNRSELENIRVDHYPLLCFSVVHGKNEFVKFFLDNNINLNSPCHSKPVTVTAAKYDNLEALKMLAEKRFDLDAKDDKGQTALHSASKYGRTEIVKFLLSFNAGTGIKDSMDNTALAYATMFKHQAIIELLSKPVLDQKLPAKN